MKSLFPLWAFLALVVCSCSEKSFTIQGQIEDPDLSSLPDSLLDQVEMPDMEGKYVYLLDLDGDFIDSVQVADGKFQFEGKVNVREPYFVYFACDLGIGMLAIEPGTITLSAGDRVVATGTPLNDTMADIDAAVENMQNDLYAEAEAIAEQYGNTAADSLLLPVLQKFSTETFPQLLDSFYQANSSNLAGLYALNVLTAYARSADELETQLSDYPTDIIESELFQKRLEYLRQYEASMQMMMQQYEMGEESAE